jgi:hypothetical protein
MRKESTPPYCRLHTTVPIRYQSYDKALRPIKVTGIYKFESFWHPAKTLRQLLRECKGELSRYGKVNSKDGTVGGVPVKMVPSTTYPEDQLTAAELKAPKGYRYWEVLPDSKTVQLLSVWDHEQVDVEKKTARGKRIANDSRYLPPVTVSMPPGWVIVAPFSGYLPDRNKRVVPTLEQAQAKLAGLLDGSTSESIEEVFGWPNQEDLVHIAFKRRTPPKKDCKFWEITGQQFKDSEKVLYRILHYFAPINIQDFYKGLLIRLHHPTGQAFIDLGTWKREIDIRLYIDKTICTQLKSAAIVRGGWAGAQKNEVSCPPEMTAWYELMVKLLQTKTMIYSGNNFEV